MTPNNSNNIPYSTQSIAKAIIIAILTLFFTGILLCVYQLPSLNPQDNVELASSLTHSMNVARHGLLTSLDIVSPISPSKNKNAEKEIKEQEESESENLDGGDDDELKVVGKTDDAEVDDDDAQEQTSTQEGQAEMDDLEKKEAKRLGKLVNYEKSIERKEQAQKQQQLRNNKNNNDSSTSNATPIPKSIWPVTIRNEDGKWIDIVHPGDVDKSLTVPPFWSKPIHDHTLMTRDRAMQIGTCATPDANGNYQRGDDCPPNDRTIFVAIASYRDWQCRFTVESIFSRATHPHRVRVAVVDQIVDGDEKCNEPIESCEVNPTQALCQHVDAVDVYEMDAPLAVGPVFARHVGHRMYRGEYYAMQSDAHVTYTKGWDVDIIEQMEATGDDMAVLTTYLTDVVGSISPEGKSLRATRPIMCNTDYEGGAQGQHLRHLSQPEGMPSIRDMPQLEPYWAAGFSFSRGHFVVNVPYDQYQPMIFQGEEMSIGIRGFTIGYDFFAPQRSVCFHHYANGKNKAKRDKVAHFWENSNRYLGVGRRAMARLLGIVHMNPETDPSEWNHAEEDMYGLGNVRTPEKFYETFGIDVVKKKTNRNLCQHVTGGKMHREFMSKLRKDGIGIDYDQITFKIKV